MLLNEKQLEAACRFNKRQNGPVLQLVSKVWPWKRYDQGSDAFAWVTALFQSRHELKVDGMMGSQTWSHAREHSKLGEVSGMIAENSKGSSNCVIIDGDSVLIPEELASKGVTVSNYIDDDEPHFRHKPRYHKLRSIVLHETCGNTARGCKNTLIKKKHGVQLIVDPYGHVSCHGDLASEVMIHANQMNRFSIGIEFVNPYRPEYARSPFGKTIPAQWWTWAPKGTAREYVLPTDAQMNTLELLIPWLCKVLDVPYTFPTAHLNRRNRKVPNWNAKPKRGRPGPGVVAHRDFATHADGRYLLDHLIKKGK